MVPQKPRVVPAPPLAAISRSMVQQATRSAGALPAFYATVDTA